MKRLIILALTISIAVASWSSCAKNTQIKTNSLYIQKTQIISTPMLITPSLTNQLVNENFALLANNQSKKQNMFFELTMIFNDKLQQFIAFIANFKNNFSKINLVANNTIQEENKGPLTTEKCNKTQ